MKLIVATGYRWVRGPGIGSIRHLAPQWRQPIEGIVEVPSSLSASVRGLRQRDNVFFLDLGPDLISRLSDGEPLAAILWSYAPRHPLVADPRTVATAEHSTVSHPVDLVPLPPLRPPAGEAVTAFEGHECAATGGTGLSYRSPPCS